MLDKLHHIPESEVHDYAASDTLAGQPIHLAMHINAGPLKNDRAAAFSLQGVPAGAIDEVMDYAAAHANVGVYEERAKLYDPNAKKRPTSSTMTLGVYDPESFQLWLRTCGDSPAYLVLNDPDHPENSGAILLRQSDRTEGNKISNFLGIAEEIDGSGMEQGSYNARVHFPPHRTLPAEPKSTAFASVLQDAITTAPVSDELDFTLSDDVHDATEIANAPPLVFTVVKQNPIDLQAVIDEAKARLELGPNTTASLLFTSDSLLQNEPATLGHPTYSDKLAAHVAEAMKTENPAQALAETFRACKVKDNESLVFLPNIQKGKGAAVAAMIFDGMGLDSGFMAQAAVDSATNYLQGYVKEHAKPDTLTDTKDLTQPPQGLDRTSS